MNEKQEKALNRVLEALSFYANSKIYWPNPIPLELECDMKTLKIVNDCWRHCEVIKDDGELAREALFEFEGEFDVEYNFQTEI